MHLLLNHVTFRSPVGGRGAFGGGGGGEVFRCLCDGERQDIFLGLEIFRWMFLGCTDFGRDFLRVLMQRILNFLYRWTFVLVRLKPSKTC